MNNLTVGAECTNFIIYYKSPVVLGAHSNDTEYDLYPYFIFPGVKDTLNFYDTLRHARKKKGEEG